MSTQTAACSCGQLRVIREGAPLRVSLCHCLECQKRTGSLFGVAARFAREHVTIEGRATNISGAATTAIWSSFISARSAVRRCGGNWTCSPA